MARLAYQHLMHCCFEGANGVEIKKHRKYIKHMFIDLF